MHLLRPAVTVLVCYILSVLATPPLALVAQYIASAVAGSGIGPTAGNDLFEYMWYGTILTATYATLPAFGAIAVMRLLRLRHWLVHVLGGIFACCVALWAFTGSPAILGDRDVLPFVAAGAGAGLVYWLCRRAFGWSDLSLASGDAGPALPLR